MSPQILLGNWLSKTATALNSVFCFLVFLIFDFLDTIFCILFKYIDHFFEGSAGAGSCYCGDKETVQLRNDGDQLSETLYRRRNVFREMGFLGFANNYSKKTSGARVVGANRWSDCGCESCLSWVNADQKLHFVIRQPSPQGIGEDRRAHPPENVIFFHGFLSSSSFWVETVFPNILDSVSRDYRLFAVDLLGFGASPKPRDCLYTLKDHLEMIEKSVICPFQLTSFHLVGHSMGCLIAIALAAKHSQLVKSVTLVAPPYFPSEDGNDIMVLHKIAEKKLWPLFLFGTSFMSWYEHLGRCVCFLVCRNHRTWERIVKLITGKSDVHFMVRDIARHTHHSAWHTMHNVICGGAKLMECYLEVLSKARVKVCVIHGDKDQIVPIECSHNIQKVVPEAEVNIIENADHGSVLFGREKDFTRSLVRAWAAC